MAAAALSEECPGRFELSLSNPSRMSCHVLGAYENHSSLGIPFMKKSGLMIVAVCAVSTGVWGISHVAAFQDALGDEAAAAVDNQDGERSPDDATIPTATDSNKSRPTGIGAQLDFSLRWKEEREQRLYEIMDSHLVKNLSFPGDNPLSDILKQLSEDLTTTQGESVRIFPDTPALDAEGIASLQDVIIKDVELDNVPAGPALDLVLR